MACTLYFPAYKLILQTFLGNIHEIINRIVRNDFLETDLCIIYHVSRNVFDQVVSIADGEEQLHVEMNSIY